MVVSVRLFISLSVVFTFCVTFFAPPSAIAASIDDVPLIELKTKCDAGGIEYCVDLAEGYRSGIWLPKKPTKALNMFESYCEQNNMIACFRAGLVYYRGEITKKDEQRALTFISKACTGNNAAACRNVGVFYQRGYGVAADPVKAQEFFLSACNSGDAKACGLAKIPTPYNTDLSVVQVKCKTAKSCLKDGYKSVRGPEIKPTLANFNKACEYKSADGCYELAELLHTGKAYELASKRYEQACILGHSDACVALAVYYIEGKVTQNEPRGLTILASNCDKDQPNMRACRKASYRFSSKYGADIMGENKFRDYTKAAKYGSIACYANVNPDLYVCADLGKVYATGGYGLEADPVKASNAYLQGCSPANYGSGSTCDVAGLRVLRGEGMPKNIEKAISLLEAGCKVENYDACYHLAVEYDRGVNVPRNAPKAADMYKQICEPTDNSSRTFRSCVAASAAYEEEFQFSKADEINAQICKNTSHYPPEDYTAPKNSCVAVVAAKAMHQCELGGKIDCGKQWGNTIKAQKKLKKL